MRVAKPLGSRSRVRALALTGLLALLFSCAPDGPRPDGADGPEGQEGELSEDQIQRLESLGYLNFAPKTDPEAASGVVVRKEGCSCRGYDLLTYTLPGRADLIDARGRIVRTWRGSRELWDRATFTPEGDLLVVARERVGERPGQRRRVLLRLAFDGTRLWERVLPVHHYAEAMPDGRIAVLTSRSRKIPGLFEDQAALDNGLAILSPDGPQGGWVIEQEHSLYDMLSKRPDLVELQTFHDGGPMMRRDFLHANFFQWMPGGELAERDPLYAAGNVLVTLRRQDMVAAFDLASEEVIWAWGPGEVIGLHEATVLDDGHILLFDNRGRTNQIEGGEGWSRVVELDPLTRKIVWEYRADPPEDFYSHSRGTAARLEGGNTLISSSNQGRVFEVTPAGEIVWEYRTPHRDGEGHRAVLRAQRYPASFIDPLRRQVRSPPVRAVRALAFRVLADKIEHGELDSQANRAELVLPQPSPAA